MDLTREDCAKCQKLLVSLKDKLELTEIQTQKLREVAEDLNRKVKYMIDAEPGVTK